MLEGLDRERKQKAKLNFFRTRQRSSTFTSDANGTTETGKTAFRTRQSPEEAGRSWDLSSSIVSDPGGSSRWPRSRSASRPSEHGMIGSLYDLHSQGEVLSEEEEEEDDEDLGRSRDSSSSKPILRGPVPTIESVLRGHLPSESSERQNEERQPSAAAFVPHIPHPQTIGRTLSDETSIRAADSSKRTIKVVVEKLSSDTKQAWLKWI